MLRNRILFALITNFLLKSIYACTGEDCAVPRKTRGIHFIASIRNLFYNIKNYLFNKPEVTQEKSELAMIYNELLRKQKVVEDMERDLRLGKHINNEPRTIFEDRYQKSAEQLIATHGYLSESHTVLTEDGYMLTIQRVVGDFQQINDRVVILHHGLLGSSEDWLLLGTYWSLPYILVENGFDVWLLNARGNRYSRTHKSKHVDMPDFWDFSWHEMGVYDLPAAIKYIRELTRSSELNFIGHSMGATALLVLLSTRPQYNIVLKSGILLAPLAFMYHAMGPIRMFANFYKNNGYHSLAFLGQREFMRDMVFPQQIIEKYCKNQSRSCLNPLLLLGNGGSGAWRPRVLQDVMTHYPAGGSMKTILHYVQLVCSGYFHKFNYQNKGNRRKYGNDTPALYNLRGITLPLALFTSSSDWLSTVSDIQTLLSLLQDVTIHHVVKADNFGHFDFLWSPDAPELIYNFILPLLHDRFPRRNKV